VTVGAVTSSAAYVVTNWVANVDYRRVITASAAAAAADLADVVVSRVSDVTATIGT